MVRTFAKQAADFYKKRECLLTAHHGSNQVSEIE